MSILPRSPAWHRDREPQPHGDQWAGVRAEVPQPGDSPCCATHRPPHSNRGRAQISHWWCDRAPAVE